MRIIGRVALLAFYGCSGLPVTNDDAGPSRSGGGVSGPGIQDGGITVTPDAGENALDSGLPGSTDADAGFGDAGSVDAGSVDAGPVDAGTGVDAGKPPVPSDGGLWTRLASLPAPQQESGVAAVEGNVYIVGGQGLGNAMMDNVNRFDPVSGQWTAVRALPRPLHHVNVASVGGKLYVVGTLEGRNFAARGDTLEYDPATDVWTAKAPLPSGTERGSSAVGVIAGEIFVAGGVRSGAVTQFSAYNPVTNQHRMLPPLPMATEHVVGAAVGTRLFVIGGRNGGTRSIMNRVQIFDTTTNQWTQGPNLPTARGGHAGAVFGTRIVVIGGEGNPGASTGVFSQTEILDTTSMTWTSGTPMATPRHGMGAATVGDRIYVPGGGTFEGLRPVAVVEAYVP